MQTNKWTDWKPALTGRLTMLQITGYAIRLNNDVAGINEICNIMLENNCDYSHNAARILSHLKPDDKRGILFRRYDEIADLAVSESLNIRRGLVLSILNDLPVTVNFRVDLLDYCLQHLSDNSLSCGTRSYMINLAVKMCREHRELLNELALHLESIAYDTAPSIIAARRNAVKAINSVK